MKELYVKNFGPVTEARIVLREINLFIGEQSVGKSTLAKLITILTDHISLCNLIHERYSEWEKQLKTYNLDIYGEEKYQIIYDVEENEIKFRMTISNKKLNIDSLKDDDEQGKIDLMFKLFQSKPVFHQEKILETIKEIGVEKGRELLFTEWMNNSIYIPAERIIYSVATKLLPALSLVKSAVPQNLLRFMIDLENAKAIYPQYEIPMLGITYKNENAEDVFIINENDKKYDLRAASSGIQSVIPLLLVLEYAVKEKEYASIVVEEPECNLFPEKQVELLKHLIRVVKNENRTLTITTHSPYLLSAMNNYLYAGALVSEYGEKIQAAIDKVLPPDMQLKPNDCSVYSLGKNINGDDTYCKSLLDEETGMIDYNSLDGISESMSEEFSLLEDAFIQMNKKQ